MGTNQNTCSDLVGKLKGEDNLEDTEVDGYMTLQSVLKLGRKSLHYISLKTEIRGTFVNTAMNIWVLKRLLTSSIDEKYQLLSLHGLSWQVS
jgi:hypothetical protein